MPIILVITVTAYIKRQALFDDYRLFNYQPSAEVKKLADDTAMLDSMRRLFYVFHPTISDKEEFNTYCREDEQTIVLGCYVDRQGIYVFNVTDERLEGIEQVTAAHETLHAAYARLSEAERAKVDKMTAKAFSQLTDQNLIKRIELYREKDPSVVPNELHSILGTEAPALPDDLEDYYRKYFYDRSKIVAYAQQYEAEFTQRKNQIDEYDRQLDELKSQIDSLQAVLATQSSQLTSMRASLESLRGSGQVATYNKQVPAYNSLVKQYNNNINQLTDLISTYNEIIPKRNDIATEEQTLFDAIDSRVVPAKE